MVSIISKCDMICLLTRFRIFWMHRLKKGYLNNRKFVWNEGKCMYSSVRSLSFIQILQSVAPLSVYGWHLDQSKWNLSRHYVHRYMVSWHPIWRPLSNWHRKRWLQVESFTINKWILFRIPRMCLLLIWEVYVQVKEEYMTTEFVSV